MLNVVSFFTVFYRVKYVHFRSAVSWWVAERV